MLPAHPILVESPALNTPSASTDSPRTWTLLLLLTSGFVMSQAFRTIAAIMAAPLQDELGLDARQLGLFAAAFHFSFGSLQLFMGIGIDTRGLRRTVLAASPLMALGAVLSALATGFPMLLLGQVLIGIGSAPAFLVCTVFIARHFAPQRYALVSSITLSVGSLGMLLTGTPMAWLIEASSWRMGFWVLGACAVLSWLVIALWVHEPPLPQTTRPEPLGQAVRTFGQLFKLPHTAGIIVFALVTYASFISLRGLWLGPLLVQRHGLSLVAAGHWAVLMTVLSVFSPMLFGRADPGPHGRRRWLLGGALGSAVLCLLLALNLGLAADLTLMMLAGLVSGYATLQYPDVKDAYAPAVIGRAMALFTMALFMGVALMQWFTGHMAALAERLQREPFALVFASMAALLVLGALGFRLLPQPDSVRD